MITSREEVAEEVLQRLQAYSTECRIMDCIRQDEVAEKDSANGEEEDVYPSIRQNQSRFEAQDPLLEVNLGSEHEPRVTKISGLLNKECQTKLF